MIEDVDETWREHWSTMDLGERTHFLNVKLLDVERYLRELCRARKEGALSADHTTRLDVMAAAWERARSGTAVEMTRSVERASRQGAA